MTTISALSTSQTTATSAATSSASTSASDANESQDRFLKLLVAQLNNQDPMNPMDNAQMTSQMAQINTVTGIQQVNETLKSMATQFSSLQVMQGTSMVGRDVLIEGNTLSPSAGIAAVRLIWRARRTRSRWTSCPQAAKFWSPSTLVPLRPVAIL